MADVKKNAFLLSSASLMLAPAFVEDVYALTPEDHGVGMIREVSINLDSSLLELKNGVAQATVDSKRTGYSAGLSGTVYEMTSQNISRSMALSGATGAVKRGKLTTALVGAAVSLVIESDPIPGDTNSAITALGDIPAGSDLLLQRPDGSTDYVFPTKSTGPATGTGPGPFTVTLSTDYKLPTGMSFPIGTKVYVLPRIALGNIDADDLFCAKVVGTLSNYDRPVVVVFPKLKVAQGFNLTFNETDYGGMPWSLTPFLLSGQEATGRLADIGTKAFGDVYIGA